MTEFVISKKGLCGRDDDMKHLVLAYENSNVGMASVEQYQELVLI